MVFIGGSFISVIGALAKSPFLIQISSLVTGCTSCFGFLAWFITGNVLRWRTQGNICSGSGYLPVEATTPAGFMIKSGKFINLWNIIFYCLCGCCCCLSIIGGIMANKKKG